MRLFVGIFLDASLRDAVARLCESLRNACPSARTAVKWTQSENLHLTLKFLGNVDPERVPLLVEAIRGVSDASAFDIAFGEIQAFPSLARPQILWIGVEQGEQRLADLAARIDAQLSDIGFPKETRKFSAHLTIGRVREGRSINGFAQAAKSLNPARVGAQRVESVALIESRLTPAGPIYALQRSVALAGSE